LHLKEKKKKRLKVMRGRKVRGETLHQRERNVEIREGQGTKKLWI